VLHTHGIMLKQQEAIVQLQAAKLDAYAGLMRALGGGTLNLESDTAPLQNKETR
jgi:outer membrane protein TolC